MRCAAVRGDPGGMQLRSLTAPDDAAQHAAERLLANVERVVVGKHDPIAVVLSALISGGHILLDAVPGAAHGYPQREDEVSIVLAQRHGHPIEALEPVVSANELRGLLRAVEAVYVDDLIVRWTVDLVRATREVEDVAVGASVRGSLTLE